MQDTSYHSIDDITIWVFHEILKTGDLSLLGKHEEPNKVWLDIYDEYCKNSEVDNTNIKQMCIVSGYKAKYEFVVRCLEKLRYTYYLLSIDGIKEIHDLAIVRLREKGYLYDASKPFEDEIKRLELQSESLKMKLKIEEAKIEKADKKLAINLWKELVQLERITGVKLEPKADPIAKMIEVRLLAKEIVKKKTA